jgi:hypothetical protein
VLQRASAADAEMRAARRNAGCARGDHARNVVTRLAPDDFGIDALAGQRAFDEHHLAAGVRDASALLIQRFDREFGHGERRGLYAPVHA